MQESRPARPHSEHADRSAAADAGLDAFRRWLGCPEGQESVRQFVRQTAQDDDRTQLDDTVQDFNAFILEQILAHPTRHPFLFQWNWPEQPLQMLRYCWKTFARQRRDRLRSKGRNLKKYLYRRLRAIVADDDELASWVSPDRSFTCFHGQGLDPSRLRRPAAGDRLLRTVAVPLPAGDRDVVRTFHDARHFSAASLGAPHRSVADGGGRSRDLFHLAQLSGPVGAC